MPHTPLSSTEIDTRLQSLDGWKLERGELTRTYEFHNFRGSLDFVNRVGELAEADGHHPDIAIHYNLVKLTLVTHDAGGLTDKDFALASKINGLHPLDPADR